MHELQRCVCRKALCRVFKWVEIIFGKDLCQAVTLFILGQWDLGVVFTLYNPLVHYLYFGH